MMGFPFENNIYDPDTINVELLIRRITTKAVLVEYQNEEIWLPLSQISPSGGFDVGDTINFEMPMWLAEKNNID